MSGRGFVSSPVERWNFGDNKLECVEGVYKTVYTWDGSNFNLVDNSQCHGGRGVVTGNTIQWFFPKESNQVPFWEFKKENNRYICTSIQYKSPIVWEEFQSVDDNRKIRRAEGGDDHPKGHSGDEWELGGSIPSVLAFFAVMFSRTQLLIENLIERRKRMYVRCGAFTPSQNCKPLLCVNCAPSGECLTCSNRAGNHEGRFCKGCAVRRNFCSKCGDSLGQGVKKEGFLCDACGVGSRSHNCCRMKF